MQIVGSGDQVQFAKRSNGTTEQNNYDTGGPSGWFHMAMAWDDTDLKAYFNGVKVVSVSDTGWTDTSLDTNNVRIGSLNSSQTGAFDGNIMHYAVYDTMLSGPQIGVLGRL
jgi:hypothetical protein